MSRSVLFMVDSVGLKSYPVVIGILIVYSPDDEPLVSKHAGEFLYNKNHLCMCWCIA
jgi:hypothetical protein